MRFFIADGIAQAAPASKVVLATPVTAGCRMFKSPTEIALMQRANDITIEAFRAALATLREGMTQVELGRNIRAAFDALGATGGSALIGFGKYSAFPHGSITPQRSEEGDVVLVDGGCSVEGYQSDITRTTVFGKPTAAADRGVEPREEGADGGVQGGAGRRDVRIGRRRRAQGDHRRGLRPRLQGAGPAAPHRPRHRHGRPRVDELRARQQDAARARACASATSR